MSKYELSKVSYKNPISLNRVYSKHFFCIKDWVSESESSKCEQ